MAPDCILEALFAQSIHSLPFPHSSFRTATQSPVSSSVQETKKRTKQDFAVL